MALFKERNIREVFTVSVWLKAGNGLLEIIGGVLLLFPGPVLRIASSLAQQELADDPGSFIANTFEHYLPYLSGHFQFFAALYLLSHGVIKFFLGVALLRDELWAYPAAIGFFGIFIGYQVYRYTYAPSVFLILLTVFDLVVVWLTWHEYKVVRAHRARLG